MQNEEILNQEEHDQEMPNVEEAVKTIYAGHT